MLTMYLKVNESDLSDLCANIRHIIESYSPYSFLPQPGFAGT